MKKQEYIKKAEEILGKQKITVKVNFTPDRTITEIDGEIVEALYQLHIEGVREIIEDLEFRLIDNRIPEWDEKYKLMKMDVSRVKNNFGITE